MNIPFITKYLKRKKAEKEARRKLLETHNELLWKIYKRITDIANDQLDSNRIHRTSRYYGGRG